MGLKGHRSGGGSVCRATGEMSCRRKQGKNKNDLTRITHHRMKRRYCGRKERIFSRLPTRIKLQRLNHKYQRLQATNPLGSVMRLSRCCVCVFFLSIHSGHQVRWTYQPGSHRISRPASFCGACLNFSREKDSAIPFPRRP